MSLLVLIVETGSRRVVAGRGDVLAVGQGLGAVMDIGVRLGCLAVFVRQVRIAGKITSLVVTDVKAGFSSMRMEISPFSAMRVVRFFVL